MRIEREVSPVFERFGDEAIKISYFGIIKDGDSTAEIAEKETATGFTDGLGLHGGSVAGGIASNLSSERIFDGAALIFFYFFCSDGDKEGLIEEVGGFGTRKLFIGTIGESYREGSWGGETHVLFVVEFATDVVIGPDVSGAISKSGEVCIRLGIEIEGAVLVIGNEVIVSGVELAFSFGEEPAWGDGT